jgi:hypothetical protein
MLMHLKPIAYHKCNIKNIFYNSFHHQLFQDSEMGAGEYKYLLRVHVPIAFNLFYFYCEFGGSKSIVLRPLTAYFTNPIW